MNYLRVLYIYRVKAIVLPLFLIYFFSHRRFSGVCQQTFSNFFTRCGYTSNSGTQIASTSSYSISLPLPLSARWRWGSFCSRSWRADADGIVLSLRSRAPVKNLAHALRISSSPADVKRRCRTASGKQCSEQSRHVHFMWC